MKNEIIDCCSYLCDPFIGKQLVSLDLSDNAINPFGAIRVSKFLLNAKTLKILLINNAGLGPEGNKTIAESFIGCP